MDTDNAKALRGFVDRAVGAVLRFARESNDLSRRQLTSRMPSGIGERTLLSYEHGARQPTVARFIEICDAMKESAPDLLRRALQEAGIYLENLELHVDLHGVINDKNMRFRPMVQWARNLLNECPDGIMVVTPSAVRNLAAFHGCTRDEMARYLARFTPDPEEKRTA